MYATAINPESIPADNLLLQRQREIEEEGLSMGQKRFEDRLQKAIKNGTVADSGAAKKLLQLGIEKFQEDLEYIIKGETMAHATVGGRPSLHRKWISKIGAAKAAYITLRCALAGGADRSLLHSISCEIGKRISDELRFCRLEKEAPELFRYKLSHFATNHYMHRARSLDATIRWAEIDCSDIEMQQHEMPQVGAYLIDKLINATGFFAIERTIKASRKGPKDQVHLVPTPETAKWLTDTNSVLALLAPIYPPMVVQPLAWGPNSPGGYRFALRGRNRLVRAANKYHKKLLQQASMPLVYNALNLIQNTEWSINKKVLEVFKQVIEQGGGRAGVPSFEPLPVTPRPPNIDEDPEELRKWKRKESKRKTEDMQRSLEAMKHVRLRDHVSKYKDEPAIYFPHNLDFRGRIYPMPTVFSPQGDDIQKGLLQFATGKPLGESGVKHLAIHGANAWGKLPDGRKVSKLTLIERFEAIVQLDAVIRRIADDPLSVNLWMDADEPWCFLAFCFEWKGMRTEVGSPTEYVSHLPVASDGTCNGLQHFAALLRDPVAAEAVNVVDNKRPNDIYQTVADVVLKRLETECVDEPLALLWLNLGLVNRSLCKRPTMTLAYGAKQFGFKDQLMDHMRSLNNWKSELEARFTRINEEGEEESTLHPACVYMARLIWESLGDVVVSAQSGMEYFQKYARAVAKGNQNPTWIVPGTGFVAYQNSNKIQMVQTKTVLCGAVYQPKAYKETTEVDAVAAANGISPNIIHSLDAAALMLTVNRAADTGVTSFCMIHDSYGTHAADAELLNHELRQAFFTLYKQDVLGDLSEQFQRQVEAINATLVASHQEATKDAPKKRGRPRKVETIGLPEAPEQGNLDLSRVLVSDYFFC